MYVEPGTEVKPPVDGDETSVAGVLNNTALIDRLAVTPGGTMQEAHAGTATFSGLPVQGFNQRTFGGHLVAQSIVAAAHTVDPAWVVNSLHATFLRVGVAEDQLDYTVEVVRDGTTVAHRAAVVVQGSRELARIAMAFGAPEFTSVPDGAGAKECPIPFDVPSPDELEPLHRRRELGMPPDGIKLAPRSNWRTASRPIDIRYIDDSERRAFWFRTEPAVGASQSQQRAILAFASDRSLLPAIAYARGDLHRAGNLRTASLDHALWFHRDVHAGDWYLYLQDSPFYSARSGLARGTILDSAGAPVASVSQEGLVRSVE